MTLLLAHATSLTPAACRQRPAARSSLQVQCSKGFGEGGKGGKQAVKVSKRGKLASRPDPAARLKQLQEEQAAYEARLASGTGTGSGSSADGGSSPAAAAAAQAADDGSSKYAAMPQQVTDRMLKRILVCSGLPVASGILLFPFFYTLKVTKGIDLPTWVVYLSSTLTFGGGLAGITYGILSSSWDPRREGSLLGVNEFKANLPLLMDRFKRN